MTLSGFRVGGLILLFCTLYFFALILRHRQIRDHCDICWWCCKFPQITKVLHPLSSPFPALRPLIGIMLSVNYRVPKTVRHGTSLQRIFPKMFIDSSPSQLESQTSVRQVTVKLFGSSSIQIESQRSVCWPTLKLFGSSPHWLESQASVRWPSTVAETIWLESQSSVIWLTQKLLTHIPAVCPSTGATSNESRPRRLSSYCYRN